jgi:outer membrane receptor for ferrienterochelin and colicins
MRIRLSSIAGIILLTAVTDAATITVGGKVTDATGKAIPDALVEFQEADARTFSNIDGYYTISVGLRDQYTVQLSHLNFGTVTVNLAIEPDEGGAVVADLTFSDQRIYPVQGITVAANRGGRRVEMVPQPVAIVDAATIRKEYYRNAGDVLDQIAGVRVIRNGQGAGTDFGLSIRSLNGGPTANKSLVLVDGIPFNSGPDAGVNFNALPTANIDRIEVVKGAASALYGSQATAGVINIITRTPEIPGFSGSAAFEYEMDNAAKVTNVSEAGYNRPKIESSGLWMNTNYRFKDADLSLFVGRNQAEDYYFDSDTTDIYEAIDLKIKYRQTWTPRWQSFVSANLLFTSDDSPAFEGINSENLNSSFAFGANHFNPFAQIDLHVYWNRNDNTDKAIASALTSGAVADRIGGQVNLKKAFFRGKGLVNTGIEVFGDFYTEDYTQAISNLTFKEINEDDIAVYEGNYGDGSFSYNAANIAWYLQYEHALAGNLHLTAGMRLDYHSQYGSVFSPKLGLAVQLLESADYTVTLKQSYASGFRAPNLRDLYSNSINGYGDTALKPEETGNVDVSLMQRFFELAELEVSYFRMHVKNLIINDKSGPTGAGYAIELDDASLQFFNLRRNLGTYNPSGWEISGRITPTPEFRYYAAYTYLDPQDFTFQTSRNRFYHRLEYLYAFTDDSDLSLSFSQDYTGDGYFRDFQNYPYEAYRVYDGRISLRFMKSYRLSLIGKNLSDAAYGMFARRNVYYQPGRTFLLKAEIAY